MIVDESQLADKAFTAVNGLSGSVVDAKTLGWLDLLRMSDEPLVRAAGVLKVASLNGEFSNEELIDVIEKVKQARVQAEALLQLNKRLDASADLLVVGAYPSNGQFDQKRPGQIDGEAARRSVAAVPLPERDPVSGLHGPVIDLWRAN